MRRRALLALALVFLWAAPSHAAFVQSKVGTDGFGTTQTAAFTSNVTAANLIVVVIGTFQATSTVTDSLSNAYTQSDTVSGGSVIEVWYAKNVTGGANTVTATWGSAANGSIVVAEYSALNTSTPLDVHNSVATTPGVSTTDGDTSPSVTTTASGETIIGALFDATGSSGTFTAGTGYTSRVNALVISTYRISLEDKTQTSAGAVAATWTGGGTSAYEAVIATFKSSTAAAVTASTLPVLGAGR